MTVAAGAVLAGALGLAFGSFLNVVAHRLPRRESLSKPRSRCPHCGAHIRARDNIPVLGWLLLGGKCRDCGAPISKRYPLVEAGTALLCVLVVLVEGIEPEALLGIVFVLLLVPITLIDLDHGIIPNKLTLLGSVLGFTLVAVFFTDELVEHVVAAVLAGGFLLLAAVVYPAGMGMGDVKLAFVMGLFLGRAVAPAMFVAFLTGSIVGIAMMARYGAEARKRTIPFGPWLAFGGVVGLLVGDEIVDWYLGTFT
jgi:leader peptidase (prepilin peptidase) / N-methyltransferase